MIHSRETCDFHMLQKCEESRRSTGGAEMDDERYDFHDEESDADDQGPFQPEQDTEKENAFKRSGSRGKNRTVTVFTVLLTVCIIGSLGYYGISYWNMLKESRVPEKEQETEERIALRDPAADYAQESEVIAGNARAMVLDVSGVVAEVLPSVVAITSKSIQEVEYLFWRRMEIENESSGSGFIIAETQNELLIATNAHVVEDAAALNVCFTVDEQENSTGPVKETETDSTAADNHAAADEDSASILEIDSDSTVVEAIVKGIDTSMDLAVVSVALEDIPERIRSRLAVATLGASSDLLVGEPAVAIGNALGYGQSVTLGIISALNREVTVDNVTNRLIQTDAAINFGNSGGVLINVDGEVIGINSAKAAANGAEGMGYAIPIDDAKPVLAELMNRVTRTKVAAEEIGYLGISPRDISVEGRSLYNMPRGIFVYEVASGSPAEKAGIVRGDIITQFDGNTVTSSERLGELLEYYAAGEQIELEVQSIVGGSYQARKVIVTLE